MAHGLEARISRRQLLAGGGGLALAAALPGGIAEAQTAARWHRYDVRSNEGKAMLRSYDAGVRAMLALPVSDPRNWYRVAFAHFLDCPHGNWWILPWHRGFTGFVEQMVRQMSGDPDFAFPYWDWTAQPQVPPEMAGSTGALNPNNFAGQYSTLANFHNAFEPALAAYWNTPVTLQQLQYRGMATQDDMWVQIADPPDGPAFFQPPNARSPLAPLDCVAGAAVAQPMIDIALSPQDFITFGSHPAQHHSEIAGFGLLEAQPHNKVHNNVGGVVYQGTIGNCDRYQSADSGGFMQNNLSPVDPLFFLHHSNLDRLWDEWTRAQVTHNLPTLPEGADYQQWAGEPFLFFSDGGGRPVSPSTAGDYEATAPFGYDYLPGTMARPMLGFSRAQARRARRPVRYYSAEVPAAAPGRRLLAAQAAPIALRLTPALLREALAPDRALLAKVMTALPPHRRGQLFRVLVHGGDPTRSVEAGSIAMFGHASHHGPASFTVPIGAAIAQLRRSSGIRPGGLLHFRVIAPPAADHAHGAAAASSAEQDLRVLMVQVEAH